MPYQRLCSPPLFQIEQVPSRFWRRICFWVVQSPVFTACVTLFVFLNILVLGATFYGESSEWQDTKSRVRPTVCVRGCFLLVYG